MDARQQRRAQVKRQDWACRRGEDYLLLSDNVIQLGKDRAENPKLFKTRVSRYRFGQTSHQEEPRNIGRTSPGTMAALHLVVDELLTAQSAAPMAAKRGGDFGFAVAVERTFAYRAGNTPSLYLASHDRFRITVGGDAFRARMHRRSGDQPV